MSKKYKNRLKAMQEGWANNREFEPDVPAGIYQMQLQSAELVESKSSGNLQIERHHLVLEGEYANEDVKDYLQLETEKGPRFVAQWIEQMGYEVPEDIMDIEDVVEAISDASPTVKAELRISDGGFNNVRIKELLDEGSGEGEGEGEEGDELEVGDEVTFKDDDGEEHTGTVTEIGEDTFTVEDEDDEPWELTEDDLVEEEEEEEGEGEGEEEEGDGLAELLAFAQSQDIDADEDDDVESLTEKILEYEWDTDELTNDEIELLEGIEATFKKGKKAAKKASKKSSKKGKKGKKK